MYHRLTIKHWPQRQACKAALLSAEEFNAKFTVSGWYPSTVICLVAGKIASGVVRLD